jgi:outer membrane receptor for ferrienterochelin and colicins
MKTRLLTLALSLALPLPALAQDEAGDDEFAELLDVLAEETEVATRTKMNSDYVPGIVTVLDARTLEALGARTVWDALSHVPGVEAWRDPAGTPTITVRGIPFPFNSGSVQVLFDSVPIAAEAAGLNGAALLLPLAQVERIEFVRGPGSVVYGDYAFQGLLNVVTRTDAGAVEVADGSHDEHWGNLRLAGAGERWHASAQVAAYDTNDAAVPANRSADEERRYAAINLGVGGFELVAHSVARDLQGNDAASANTLFNERSSAVEARYKHAFGESLEVRARLQHLSNDLGTGGVGFEGGHDEAGLDLLYTGWSGQTWLGGVEYNHGEIDSAFQRQMSPPGQPPRPPTEIGARSRRAVSVYAQGQFALTDTLQATLGARWDDNSTIGTRVTPRASLVWRAAENHILKAQYAEGFRSPTFFELYITPGQPMLDYEVNRTFELNYVYSRPGSTARATLFRSRIDDMVFRNFGGIGFANVAQAESEGVELEWNRQFGSRWRFDTALGWFDSRHNRNTSLTDVELLASADWLANVGLLWTPGSRSAVGLHWNRVGTRGSAPPGATQYDRVDLAYTRRHLGWDGLELQLGVSNALDETTVFLNPAPTGDMPIIFQRRSAWVRLAWEW